VQKRFLKEARMIVFNLRLADNGVDSFSTCHGNRTASESYR
jgi:hypothetical protein